jgi:hypothetical protein
VPSNSLDLVNDIPRNRLLIRDLRTADSCALAEVLRKICSDYVRPAPVPPCRSRMSWTTRGSCS